MNQHLKEHLIRLADSVYNHTAPELPRNCSLPPEPVAALNQYFDAIWVLTIRRNAERRGHMQEQLAGVRFEFFEGVDGTTLRGGDERIDLEGACALARRSVRVNELAATMSHVRMFQAVVDRGLQRVLIFEDDAVLLAPQAHWIQYVLERMPAGWEFLYFGYLDGELRGYLRELQERLGRRRDPAEVVARTVGRGLRTAAGHECIHAYGITLAGARKLVEGAYPIRHTADGWVEHNVLGRRIEAYISVPKIFVQRSDLGSSIHMTRGKR